MVTHKNFESNAKRLAMVLMKVIKSDGEEWNNLMMSGNCRIQVSSELIKNIKAKDETKYINEMNKYLKICKVTKIGRMFDGRYFLIFDVDWIDAEINP